MGRGVVMGGRVGGKLVVCGVAENRARSAQHGV